MLIVFGCIYLTMTWACVLIRERECNRYAIQHSDFWYIVVPSVFWPLLLAYYVLALPLLVVDWIERE